MKHPLDSERIVLIGAGSASFTVGLLADMIARNARIDLSLVDIDASALRVATQLATRMITARNAPITLRAAQDRREVLPGATVVICTVGVGGRRAWEQDVFVPRRYGINMPVGDTVGPGGSSRALRMIPAMVAIAQDVLTLAPDALFFNYSNPMAPICRAIRKATGANVVGLCHGVHDTGRYLAEKLGVELERIRYNAVGINHLTWFTDVRVDGLDAMPQLRQIAAQKVAAFPNSRIAVPTIPVKAEEVQPFSSPEDHPFSWHLLHSFGAIPSALDRHVTEFFPQLFGDGAYYGKTLGKDIFSFEGTIARGDSHYAEMRQLAESTAPLPAEYLQRFEGEHEQVIDIIEAIRGERGTVYSANLANVGQVPNLPQAAIVEAPAIASAGGLQPIMQPALPTALAGSLATRYQWVECIVEAALERSREKFIQALVLDGAVESIHQATALADELLAVQMPFLQW